MIKPKTRFEEFLAKIAGVAYGKNTVPKSRIEKWLEKIAQNMLPAATTADAGKVPTVQADGSYALTEGSGGGSSLIVHDNPEGLLDKTWEEIYNAMDAGNIPVIKSRNSDGLFFDFILSTSITFPVGGGSEIFEIITMNKNKYKTNSRSGYPIYESSQKFDPGK